MTITILALLPRTTRSGVFTTPDIAFPAAITNFIAVRANINPTDLIDPTMSGAIDVEISRDNGQTWQFFMGMTWVGNSNMRNGQPVQNPAVGTYDIAQLQGTRVRARCNFPKALRTGFVVEYE